MPALLTKDVERAKALFRLIDHLADLPGPDHVGVRIRHLHTSLGGQIGADPLDLSSVAEAVQRDAGTRTSQCPCDTKTDAAGGTGYECCLPLTMSPAPKRDS
jgi:hypothetical protein